MAESTNEEAEQVRLVSGHAFRRAESALEKSAFRRSISGFMLHHGLRGTRASSGSARNPKRETTVKSHPSKNERRVTRQ